MQFGDPRRKNHVTRNDQAARNKEVIVRQGSSKYSREHDLAHLVQCTGLK